MDAREYHILRHALATMKYFSYWLWDTEETGRKRKKTVRIRPDSKDVTMSIDVAEYHIYNYIKKKLEEYENLSPIAI